MATEAMDSDCQQKFVEKRRESQYLGELRNILQFVFFHIQLASTHICSNKTAVKAAANIQCKHLSFSNPTIYNWKKIKTHNNQPVIVSNT